MATPPQTATTRPQLPPTIAGTSADVAVSGREWVDLDALDVVPPPNTASNEYLLQFLRRRTYRSSPLYLEDYSRHRKSEMYDQGFQWVQKARGAMDTAYAYQWHRLSYIEVDGQKLPLPVYNEGVLLRENESARLGRPEYKPRVRPNTQNPGIKEKDGAKGCERALLSRTKDMWSNEEDKLFLHLPLYGGAWIKSHWDQTWLETVRIPAPSMCCPRRPKQEQEEGEEQQEQQGVGGGPQEEMAEGEQQLQQQPPMPMQPPQPLGQSQLPPSMPEPMPEMPGLPGQPPSPQPQPQPQMDLFPAPPPITCNYCTKTSEAPADQSCPLCPDHPPLIPYKPSMAEALDTNLGMDVPKGDWFMKVVYPYNMFPRDGGVGVDPTDLDEWVECYPTPIAEMEARYPQQIRDHETGQLRVHPQNAASLMSENPTLGSPDLLQYAALHSSIYRTHVVVYEYNRKPWLEWDADKKQYTKNRGRTIVGVTGQGGGGVVCYDGVLMLESLNKPGTFVARTKLQFVPWELVDGGRRGTVGQSLWDRLFDPQDGINERASQTRAVNQRGAIPFYLEMAGSNLEMLDADVAVPFRRIRAYIDPNARQLPLQLLNNDVINPGVYAEIDFNINYMSKNIVEVEKGQVPPGVAAATAIAYLKTESGEKRRPRILRIRRALVRDWEHGAQLMSALYIEPRPYTFEDEDGDERQAFLEGKVVAQANPKVDIYPTPDYDVTDARRESIRDMVQLGILDPKQTPQLSRKIVAAMDESLEFFVDDDLQEQQAQREWRDFMDKGRVPVVDPSLDDDLSHYMEHGRACFSEWFRQKEDEAHWDEALSVISSDWDQIKEVVMNMLLLPPPPAVDPATGDIKLDPQTGMPVKPAPKPSIQDMLSVAWSIKLQQAQFPANPTLTNTVIPWRAHMEAHNLKVELQRRREMMMAVPPKQDAPAKGSTPTSQVEEQSGGAPEVSQPAPAPGAVR